MVYNRDSQRVVYKPYGVPETLSEDLQAQKYFHNTTKMWCAFFTVVTFALMAEKQWWVKLLPPYHKSRRRHKNVPTITVFFIAMHLWFKKKSISLRNALDEVAKIILLYLNPSACLFDILWYEMGRTHKACQLHMEVWWWSQGKAPPVIELWAELAAFFMEHPFLSDGTTNR